MNNYSEVARTYATAIYEMASEEGKATEVLNEMRALADIFDSDKEISGYLSNPLIPAQDRRKALSEAVEKGGVSESVQKVISLLDQRNRMASFGEIAGALQDRADEANGVTRGVVRSAAELGPDDRKKIEDLVKSATGKEVILTYEIDTSVVGGLIAQVGSFTFDDTIDSHLRRMKEELNRSRNN